MKKQKRDIDRKVRKHKRAVTEKIDKQKEEDEDHKEKESKRAQDEEDRLVHSRIRQAAKEQEKVIDKIVGQDDREH